ncbi:MAG TPA: Ig-like domain-containing protein, partial [Candidatus Limnocylindria bacterium]
MVITVVIATMAASGLLVGPRPQPANAGLVATGVNDRHTVKHDRVLTVPAPGVLGNDLNLLGATTAILVSGVSHGTLALRSDGGFTYTPAARYVGTDSFRYRPSGLLSTAATVTITVTNTAPVARPDAYAMVARTTLVIAAPGVLGNDSDADGDTLTVEMVGGGISGSLDLDPNGGFRYTPGGGASGTVTFSYRVWDGIVWSSSTTVSITITAAPTPTPAPTPRSTPAPTASPTPTPRPTATPIL